MISLTGEVLTSLSTQPRVRLRDGGLALCTLRIGVWPRSTVIGRLIGTRPQGLLLNSNRVQKPHRFALGFGTDKGGHRASGRQRNPLRSSTPPLGTDAVNCRGFTLEAEQKFHADRSKARRTSRIGQ